MQVFQDQLHQIVLHFCVTSRNAEPEPFRFENGLSGKYYCEVNQTKLIPSLVLGKNVAVLNTCSSAFQILSQIVPTSSCYYN